MKDQIGLYLNDDVSDASDGSKHLYHCGCCHAELTVEHYRFYGGELEADQAEFGHVYCDTCNGCACRCEVIFELYPSSVFDTCPGCGEEQAVINHLKASEFDSVPYERF